MKVKLCFSGGIGDPQPTHEVMGRPIVVSSIQDRLEGFDGQFALSLLGEEVGEDIACSPEGRRAFDGALERRPRLVYQASVSGADASLIVHPRLFGPNRSDVVEEVGGFGKVAAILLSLSQIKKYPRILGQTFQCVAKLPNRGAKVAFTTQ